MKLTNELLQQIIMEEVIRISEKDSDEDETKTDAEEDDSTETGEDKSPPSWKLDPLGNVEVGLYKDKSKSYDDDERQSVLVALRTAFNGVLDDTEVTKLANLTEHNKITEKKGELEYDDILAALDDDNIQFDDKGKMTSGSKDALSFAKKVEKAIDRYIANYIKNVNQPDKKAKIQQLLQSKEEYMRLVAKARKLRLSDKDTSGILPVQRAMMTQVSKVRGDGSYIGPDVSKAAINPSTIKVFENFFSDAPTVKDKIQKIQNLSKKIADLSKSSGTNLTLDEGINGAAIINMLSQSTRMTDASGAGYEAESFLAMLVAGVKVGASNGAGDFEGPNGKQYSAKWLIPTSGISQAGSGFKTKGEVVTYVCAMKVGGTIGDAPDPEDDSGDLEVPLRGQMPQSVGSIKIGLFDVVTKDPGRSFYTVKHNRGFDVDNPDFNLTYAGGSNQERNNETNLKGASGTKLTFVLFSSAKQFFAMADPSDVYTVNFVESSSEEFEDVYARSVKNSTNAALKQVVAIYNKLKIIQEESLDFANDQSMAAAYNMVDAYGETKTHMKDLFNSFDDDNAAALGLSEQTENKLEENKTNQEKLLDKLIQEVILNK